MPAATTKTPSSKTASAKTAASKAGPAKSVTPKTTAALPPATPGAVATPLSNPVVALVDAGADDDAESTGKGTLRLKELVDRVVASTGGKKKDTKEIVEATLTQLGLALTKGEMLNLPEFGKLRVARPAGAAPGSAMTLKLRPSGKAAAKGPGKISADGALAEPEDRG